MNQFLSAFSQSDASIFGSSIIKTISAGRAKKKVTKEILTTHEYFERMHLRRNQQ